MAAEENGSSIWSFSMWSSGQNGATKQPLLRPPTPYSPGLHLMGRGTKNVYAEEIQPRRSCSTKREIWRMGRFIFDGKPSNCSWQGHTRWCCQIFFIPIIIFFVQWWHMLRGRGDQGRPFKIERCCSWHPGDRLNVCSCTFCVRVFDTVFAIFCPAS